MYKVLLYDNDAQFLNTMTNNINWHDYHFSKVLFANEGKEAFKLIYTHHPELVITEICMPQDDGFTLLHTIQDYACEKVVISVSKDFDSIRAALKLRVSDYILKTEVMHELPKCLEQFTLRSVHQLPVFQPLEPRTYHHFYVNKVIEFMKQNYHTHFNVSHLAKALHVSESYVMRIFKAEVGISIKDYLNRYRTLMALNFLNQHYKHYEIAQMVGFNDYKNYIYHFKKYVGVTPTLYRNMSSTSNNQKKAKTLNHVLTFNIND
ncbi:helix-turn-helix domain-containing protein [Staphylococcus massiliensis]|uniref:response regulator transcription factor n=1 Tax=Staphylococcus massiliensis TaxID=555791 RepID=UPI001EDDA7B3|nr:helix-turn-helix domain-containing protein [Staphylococcus massiliensis]MCG3398591.1 AraC family transcriptional regulator [Staphylococcus massiliensis]